MTERQQKDEFEMTKKVQFLQFGAAGLGTIAAGPDQQERLEEFTERVGGGEFHVPISWSDALKKMLLVRCVDGRIPETGANTLGPNSAGGSESLFVADDLTEKRFASTDGTTLGGYANTIHYLNDNDYEVGGHTDEHADDEKSGCGATDKLSLIYAYMAQFPDVLCQQATALGVVVTDEAHELITRNASQRTEFSNGHDLLKLLIATADEQFVDRLNAGHKEVLTVVNTQLGTTLDRDAVVNEFGPDYQAFNVDAWAFEKAAHAISQPDTSEEMIAAKVVALTYYNLATAFVLSGPGMRLAQVVD
ncbi:MAG: cadmium-containing carbonic anhydrase [Candidatus Saccharimonadales bacterium]